MRDLRHDLIKNLPPVLRRSAVQDLKERPPFQKDTYPLTLGFIAFRFTNFGVGICTAKIFKM